MSPPIPHVPCVSTPLHTYLLCLGDVYVRLPMNMRVLRLCGKYSTRVLYFFRSVLLLLLLLLLLPAAAAR